jgi:hypothetical protein
LEKASVVVVVVAVVVTRVHFTTIVFVDMGESVRISFGGTFSHRMQCDAISFHDSWLERGRVEYHTDIRDVVGSEPMSLG